MPIQQSRSRMASLWQSALDEATAKMSAGGAVSLAGAGKAPVQRPMDQDIANHQQAIEAIERWEFGKTPLPEPRPPGPGVGLSDTVMYCSITALKIGEAKVKAIFKKDKTELKKLEKQLKAKFGQCDPKWSEAIESYVRNRIAAQNIPYRPYNDIGEYVITDRLPNDGLVALLADWGTGDPAAKGILKCIAARTPATVIHLGDVYYSGTEHEFQNYFYAIWQQTLGLPLLKWNTKPATPPSGPATFTLSGNHDMYAGGMPYYATIDLLGQPASYFCLRNDHWQFIALDTGLHDANPTKSDGATFLEDSEVAWLKDKIATRGNRKTVLLTHHQLFTGFKEEQIEGKPINEKLLAQVQDVLPEVDVWFWGHEHNLVIFEKYSGVLGRCIGHASFPVSTRQKMTRNNVPVKTSLTADPKKAFYPHGYVTIQLNGTSAQATYYLYDPDAGTETQTFQENF